MKTMHTRVIAGFLAAVFLMLTLVGCKTESENMKIYEPSDGPGYDELVETDKLVLYCSSYNVAMDRRSVDMFKALYDVEVEIVVVPAEEYEERVINDLMAGNGPDIVFLYNMYQSMDINKAALNNNFLDLTNVLAEDPEFTDESYVAGVFDAAQIHGRQYVVPLSYDVLYTLASGEKLDDLGYRQEDTETMSDFLKEISRLTPDAQQGTGFQQMLQAKNHFYQLFMNSGVRLIDYEKGKILPDEKELRGFLEGYKAYFPYDYDGTGLRRITSTGDRALFWGQSVFWYPLTISGATTTISQLKNESFHYVMQQIPGETGEIIGSISGPIAINANAKNTLNAYLFIKFLLSFEEQSNPYNLFGGVPVHLEAIRKTVCEAPSIKRVNNVDMYDYDEPALTDEEAAALMEILTGVDRYLYAETFTRTMLMDSMLPYFQDEMSYKSCLAELRSKLTFYLSE